jgi:hypothetical protein
MLISLGLWFYYGAIWHARRKAVHEKVFQSPLSTLSFIDRFISDLGCQAKPERPQLGGRTVVARWIPPPSECAKINADAALSKNDNTVAVAAIARDATGRFLGASAVVTKMANNPEILEATVCREGLALAYDLYLRRIKLASDCANVI